MNTKHSFGMGLVALLALGLAACGGGGGDSGAATTASAAPAPDNSTLERFLAYQKTLAPVEVIEPATLQTQLAPIDDTAEPVPVN